MMEWRVERRYFGDLTEAENFNKEVQGKLWKTTEPHTGVEHYMVEYSTTENE